MSGVGRGPGSPGVGPGLAVEAICGGDVGAGVGAGGHGCAGHKGRNACGECQADDAVVMGVREVAIVLIAGTCRAMCVVRVVAIVGSAVVVVPVRELSVGRGVPGSCVVDDHMRQRPRDHPSGEESGREDSRGAVPHVTGPGAETRHTLPMVCP